MRFHKTIIALVLGMLTLTGQLLAQTDTTLISDVIRLRDGSQLKGKITRWDFDRGLELKLLTGSEVVIPKKEIRKVKTEVVVKPVIPASDFYPRKPIGPKPYQFRENGLYHNASAFIHTSSRAVGAGISYAAGYRFNKYLGLGGGIGFETNEFGEGRNIIPIFAEVRGFLLSKKISPYYAIKAGYGAALRNEEFSLIGVEGGLYLSPEIGVRFGGGSAVSYFVGLEYKLLNATYTYTWAPWSGRWFPPEGYVDNVHYRRIEIRTGLLF